MHASTGYGRNTPFDSIMNNGVLQPLTYGTANDFTPTPDNINQSSELGAWNLNMGNTDTSLDYMLNYDGTESSLHHTAKTFTSTHANTYAAPAQGWNLYPYRYDSYMTLDRCSQNGDFNQDEYHLSEDDGFDDYYDEYYNDGYGHTSVNGRPQYDYRQDQFAGQWLTGSAGVFQNNNCTTTIHNGIVTVNCITLPLAGVRTSRRTYGSGNVLIDSKSSSQVYRQTYVNDFDGTNSNGNARPYRSGTGHNLDYRSSHQQHGEIVTGPTEIESYSENDVPVYYDGVECLLCYERYREMAEMSFLPCGHHFHRTCLQDWRNTGYMVRTKEKNKERGKQTKKRKEKTKDKKKIKVEKKEKRKYKEDKNKLKKEKNKEKEDKNRRKEEKKKEEEKKREKEQKKREKEKEQKKREKEEKQREKEQKKREKESKKREKEELKKREKEEKEREREAKRKEKEDEKKVKKVTWKVKEEKKICDEEKIKEKEEKKRLKEEKKKYKELKKKYKAEKKKYKDEKKRYKKEKDKVEEIRQKYDDLKIKYLEEKLKYKEEKKRYKEEKKKDKEERKGSRMSL